MSHIQEIEKAIVRGICAYSVISFKEYATSIPKPNRQPILKYAGYIEYRLELLPPKYEKKLNKVSE